MEGAPAVVATAEVCREDPAVGATVVAKSLPEVEDIVARGRVMEGDPLQAEREVMVDPAAVVMAVQEKEATVAAWAVDPPIKNPAEREAVATVVVTASKQTNS